MIKIAINGFGRIGRLSFRKLFDNDKFEIVAINDLSEIRMLSHLLKYDSVQGGYHKHKISYEEGKLIVGTKEIKVFSERNVESLPWGELDVDIVIECTGAFRRRKQDFILKLGLKKLLYQHLQEMIYLQ